MFYKSYLLQHMHVFFFSITVYILANFYKCFFFFLLKQHITNYIFNCIFFLFFKNNNCVFY